MATRLTRPESAARTRRALLGAAERRFLSDGYHAASLETIAADAGYTKGAIFAAFESKAGLFLVVCEEVFARRLEQLRTLFERHPTRQERLDALAAQPVDNANQRWLLVAIEFWTQSASDPEHLAALAGMYRRLHTGLAELVGQDAGPLGTQNWTTVILALTNGLTLHRLLDPRGVPNNLMAATVSLLLDQPG